ncbi:ATP synthase F0 subunit B [uncultured Desulfuromusa sp.]|uniref:ATP synthase F0 subunit B n=1 Tax=uncultured Desulfuromusa sp. TaxID=219183 RepID=UPI002AA77A95|nr:ATP synthase F0 subunit B [uncultured Desulfuromusa sp.]
MISVDWTLGLQFLNFIILLVVLNKLLYRPLKKVIAERAEKVTGSLAAAKNLETDIDEKMQRYQQQLSDAKIQANDERNKLKKSANEEEAKILLEAQGKAAARMQAIKTQVGKEAEEADKTLKKEAGALAGQIATKILGRELA